MKWEKLGVIIEPNEDYNWMSDYASASFVEILKPDAMRVYVTGRDNNGISRIGVVDLSLYDMNTILSISEKPCLDVGNIGCFDESGVSYPWIVSVNGIKYMYYVGWIAGGIGGFINSTGLAMSTDGGKSFHRTSKAPILGRTHSEPIGTGSVCVLREGNIWRLWYTSFVKWERTDGEAKHFYHIKYAESLDGANWNREGRIAVDFRDEFEYVIAKPCVVREKGIYKMWYSYRGDSYRIGYAESTDGINWARKDSEVGIDVSDSGWDSEMIEYGFVFGYRGNRYMVYNGNKYGKTGLGLARLVQ